MAEVKVTVQNLEKIADAVKIVRKNIDTAIDGLTRLGDSKAIADLGKQSDKAHAPTKQMAGALRSLVNAMVAAKDAAGGSVKAMSTFAAAIEQIGNKKVVDAMNNFAPAATKAAVAGKQAASAMSSMAKAVEKLKTAAPGAGTAMADIGAAMSRLADPSTVSAMGTIAASVSPAAKAIAQLANAVGSAQRNFMAFKITPAHIAGMELTFQKVGNAALGAAPQISVLHGHLSNMSRTVRNMQGLSLRRFFGGIGDKKAATIAGAFDKLKIALDAFTPTGNSFMSGAFIQAVMSGQLAAKFGSLARTVLALSREFRELNKAIRSTPTSPRVPKVPGGSGVGGGGFGNQQQGPSFWATKMPTLTAAFAPILSGARTLVAALGPIGTALTTSFSVVKGVAFWVLRISASVYFLSYIVKSIVGTIAAIVKPVYDLSVYAGQFYESMEKAAIVMETRFGKGSGVLEASLSTANDLGVQFTDILENIVTLTNSIQVQDKLVDPLGNVDTESMQRLVRMMTVIKETQPDIWAKFGSSFGNMLGGDARSFAMGFEITPEGSEALARRRQRMRVMELEQEAKGATGSRRDDILAKLEQERNRKIVRAEDFRSGKDTLGFVMQQTESIVDPSATEKLANMVSAQVNRIKNAWDSFLAAIVNSGPYDWVNGRLKKILGTLERIQKSELSKSIATFLMTGLDAAEKRIESIFGKARAVYAAFTTEGEGGEKGSVAGGIGAAVASVLKDLSTTLMGALAGAIAEVLPKGTLSYIAETVGRLAGFVGMVVGLLYMLLTTFGPIIMLVGDALNVLVAVVSDLFVHFMTGLYQIINMIPGLSTQDTVDSENKWRKKKEQRENWLNEIADADSSLKEVKSKKADELRSLDEQSAIIERQMGDMYRSGEAAKSPLTMKSHMYNLDRIREQRDFVENTKYEEEIARATERQANIRKDVARRAGAEGDLTYLNAMGTSAALGGLMGNTDEKRSDVLMAGIDGMTGGAFSGMKDFMSKAAPEALAAAATPAPEPVVDNPYKDTRSVATKIFEGFMGALPKQTAGHEELMRSNPAMAAKFRKSYEVTEFDSAATPGRDFKLVVKFVGPDGMVLGTKEMDMVNVEEKVDVKAATAMANQDLVNYYNKLGK